VGSWRLHVDIDAGSEQEIGAGDMYVIRPGHDASIVGDETFVRVDFSSNIEWFAKSNNSRYIADIVERLFLLPPALYSRSYR
jgi:hypothetical protein